ncbi:hypothetical protein CVT25_009604 [Psilocybe cyanescens]|uniref:Uncharacterized protein n=1 Tax=Psilocybe cyanescens TaxID=93625 RepID=A0A409XGT9_PSICY|nr:hypothetical protein CVT25_009604 [Psilocybe cyanescens]
MRWNGGGHRAQLLAIALFVAASLYLTWSLAEFAKNAQKLVQLRTHARRSHIVRPLDSYSFVGGDHPKRLPIKEKLVKTVVQESVHFDLIAPESEAEWLWTASVGDGHIRLGKEKRMFAVAMFHELHCLRAIRNVMEKGWDTFSKPRQGHILHCYNYLRQYTLCSADATLEPGDFTKRNFTTERFGATHTCVDWEPSYKMAEEKWAEWSRFRVAHGIPWHDDVT